MTIKVITNKDLEEHGFIEECWEIRQVVQLIRTRTNVNGTVKPEPDYFIGTFETAEEVIDFLASGRSIIDQSNVKTDDTRFCFDEGSPNWVRDQDMNTMFLNANENYFNHRLRARGFVFLNEILEKLGIPLTSFGALNGWLYKTGTGHISFDPVAQEGERYILDFNVDGVIYDKIESSGGR